MDAQSWTTGTNVMYINPASTKIGIGISSPSELFHINGGALKIGNLASAADRAINMIKIDKQTKQLQKVEELTLYLIKQQETINKLNNRREQLENGKK
jgi:hypothetical protein